MSKSAVDAKITFPDNSLIQGVLAAPRTVGMARTGHADKRPDRRRASSAISAEHPILRDKRKSRKKRYCNAQTNDYQFHAIIIA